MVTDEQHYTAVGKYYGYPDCCIKYFVDRCSQFPPKVMSSQQEKVTGYDGFIPCISCADKVTKETISTLLVDRICIEPYPDNGSMNKFNKYINTIFKPIK